MKKRVGRDKGNGEDGRWRKARDRWGDTIGTIVLLISLHCISVSPLHLPARDDIYSRMCHLLKNFTLPDQSLTVIVNTLRHSRLKSRSKDIRISALSTVMGFLLVQRLINESQVHVASYTNVLSPQMEGKCHCPRQTQQVLRYRSHQLRRSPPCSIC